LSAEELAKLYKEELDAMKNQYWKPPRMSWETW
jgi:hypothetical protein